MLLANLKIKKKQYFKCLLFFKANRSLPIEGLARQSFPETQMSVYSSVCKICSVPVLSSLFVHLFLYVYAFRVVNGLIKYRNALYFSNFQFVSSSKFTYHGLTSQTKNLEEISKPAACSPVAGDEAHKRQANSITATVDGKTRRWFSFFRLAAYQLL